MADTRSNQNNVNVMDVLAYNTSGLPLSMGVFFMTKEDCIKRTKQLAEENLGGEFTVRLEVWKDNEESEYDPERKQNTAPMKASLQIWIPKNNSSVINSENPDDNAFIANSGVTEYSQEFKKFANQYGIADEKGNVISMLGKRGDKIVLCLDIGKVLSLFVDQECRAYNQAYPANKCNRNIDVRAIAVYEGENPIDVILGGRRDKRSRNISGFVIAKTWRGFNRNNNDQYRPSFRPKKNHF